MAEPLADNLSAFILAGGRSSRMGSDKAFLDFEGRTLLARALALARSVSPEVQIVGDAAKFASFAPVVEDIFRGCGPLGGIHAALHASETELNLILAVDMPFLSFALLQFLMTRARNTDHALATVPYTNAGWQPLCAVYRKEFAVPAESALSCARCKIDPLFEEVSVRAIDEDELAEAGFSPRIFCNLNTPDDVSCAAKPKSGKQGSDS